MKKTYMQPSLMVINLATEQMLASSLTVDRQENVNSHIVDEGAGSDAPAWGDGNYWGD